MQVEGYTEDEVTAAIMEVSALFRRFSFDIYDGDDIQQELYIICLKALPKFDVTKNKNLHAFLYKHCYYRILTFIRDHTPKLVVDGEDGLDKVIQTSNHSVMLPVKEKMEQELCFSDLRDFKRMSRGVSIPRNRKLALIEKFKSIINEELDDRG